MSKSTHEEYVTTSQRAKALYSSLREQEIMSVMFTGLVADRIWVDSHNKAYYISSLSGPYLSNIVESYRSRGEVLPKAISEEVTDRLERK